MANRLVEKYNMPDERETILLFDVNNSPAKCLQTPIIKQQLIRDIGKKDEAALLMNTALETIGNYPTEWIHIYSDGSASEGTTNAGYGSLIQFPDGTSKELHDSCGKFSTNYEAEAVAIIQSIQFVSSIFEHSPEYKTNLVVFTDAKSVLQALDNSNDKDLVIRNLADSISNLITTHKVMVTLQWIPGHSHVQGNEKADELAKQGAKCHQKNVSATMNTAKQIIRQRKKEIWMKSWEESNNGRSVFAL